MSQSEKKSSKLVLSVLIYRSISAGSLKHLLHGRHHGFCDFHVCCVRILKYNFDNGWINLIGKILHLIFINREAGEIIHLVVSVRLFVGALLLKPLG